MAGVLNRLEKAIAACTSSLYLRKYRRRSKGRGEVRYSLLLTYICEHGIEPWRRNRFIRVPALSISEYCKYRRHWPRGDQTF